MAWIHSSTVGGALSVVEVADRAPGGSFGPAQAITGGATGSTTPDVAINDHGDTLAAWRQQDNSSGEVRAVSAYRPSGQPFDPAQPLTDGSDTPLNPGVGIGQHGAIAAWTADPPTGSTRIDAAVQ